MATMVVFVGGFWGSEPRTLCVCSTALSELSSQILLILAKLLGNGCHCHFLSSIPLPSLLLHISNHHSPQKALLVKLFHEIHGILFNFAFFIYFMCMGVLPICVSVCPMCAWYRQRPEEGFRLPRIEVTDGSEHLSGPRNQSWVL